MDRYLISIVIPVYEEEKQIGESINVIHSSLIKNKINFEIILVDDGSKDSTWNIIKQKSLEVTKIHAIRLSRNFGKESAICAGLETAKGNACIVMDADLQHPPEVIPEMIHLWRDEKYDIVEGVKIVRGKEKLVNKIGARLFYKLIRRLSGFDITNSSDFKLLDEKVVEAWRNMSERNTFFRGMLAWVGFKRTGIPFVVADRKNGSSKWSFFKLLKLALRAITSFSSLPLQIVTFLGSTFLIGSFFLGVQTFYMKLNGEAVDGFTTLILLQLIIGSVLLISLGIIGTYIARIYDEVKYRPRYLVSETAGCYFHTTDTD